jgi:hypothetical protein
MAYRQRIQRAAAREAGDSIKPGVERGFASATLARIPDAKMIAAREAGDSKRESISILVYVLS